MNITRHFLVTLTLTGTGTLLCLLTGINNKIYLKYLSKITLREKVSQITPAASAVTIWFSQVRYRLEMMRIGDGSQR